MEAVLDLVIPQSTDRKMPRAGSLGLTVEVAAGIGDDRSLGQAVVAGLRALSDAAFAKHPDGLPGLAPAAQLEVVQDVLATHPMLMTGLARHLYLAYYQHPLVLGALGEPARPPFPEGFAIEPTDAGLLAKLHARRTLRK